MTTAHEYTEEEIRTKLLTHIHSLISHWEALPERDLNTSITPIRARLEGLAFSILSTLDGVSTELPMFLVAPNPHPSDKNFHQKSGDNWYPESKLAHGVCISGLLHEEFYKTARCPGRTLGVNAALKVLDLYADS